MAGPSWTWPSPTSPDLTRPRRVDPWFTVLSFWLGTTVRAAGARGYASHNDGCMTNHEPLLIEARALRKLYRNGPAVDDVSFGVAPGRVVGLLGPNGAGKTTTIRMILGLVDPDGGDALISGRPYRQWPEPLTLVGAVLDAGGLHPGRTGRQHLRIAAAQAGVAASRIDAVLGEVEMTASADRRIAGYSLGMRQRLALATALLAEPRVLILDEPANGLDPAGIHWLRQRIRAFADNGGAVLLASHVLADVAQVADDIVVIAGGRVLADLPLAEVTALTAAGIPGGSSTGTGGSLERFYLELTADIGAVVR